MTQPLTDRHIGLIIGLGQDRHAAWLPLRHALGYAGSGRAGIGPQDGRHMSAEVWIARSDLPELLARGGLYPGLPCRFWHSTRGDCWIAAHALVSV